ncbi:MAG: ATP-binding protein [Thermales bacterium]|nr:ATP-binding protein [Thermales bacterium]
MSTNSKQAGEQVSSLISNIDRISIKPISELPKNHGNVFVSTTKPNSIESEENYNFPFQLWNYISSIEENISVHINTKVHGGGNFEIKITTISQSKGVNNTIYNIINSLSENQSFSKHLAYATNLIKEVPAFNPILSLFAPKFNHEQLAALFHSCNIDRGSIGVNENKIIESSPEFFRANSSNLLIGTTETKTGSLKDVYLPIKNLERHVYMVGKTGMGKSSLQIQLFLSAMQKVNHSLIMLDPHGSDIEQILMRSQNIDNCVYLDLSQNPNQVFTYNPLFSFQTNIRQKEARIERVMSIIEEEVMRKNKDLGTAIEKVLSFLVETAVHFTDAYYQYLVSEVSLSPTDAESVISERQLCFPDLMSIARDKKFQDLLICIFQNYDQEISFKWKNQQKEYFGNKIVLDGVENRLKFIIKSSLLPIFEGNKFNITELVEQNKIILLPISESSFGKQSKRILTKLLLSEIWLYNQSIQDEALRPETIIFIDEFQEAQTDIIDDLLSQARKYKIRMIFGNQYFGQLLPRIRESVRGNVSTLFTFNIGNTDEAKPIIPLFREKISDQDLASLPPFTAFVKTLNTESAQGSAFMSFNTIDYRREYPTLRNLGELRDINSYNLKIYGEQLKTVKQRRSNKLIDPQDYFFGVITRTNYKKPD